jgi:hypothetical protein
MVIPLLLRLFLNLSWLHPTISLMSPISPPKIKLNHPFFLHFIRLRTHQVSSSMVFFIICFDTQYVWYYLSLKVDFQSTFQHDAPSNTIFTDLECFQPPQNFNNNQLALKLNICFCLNCHRWWVCSIALLCLYNNCDWPLLWCSSRIRVILLFFFPLWRRCRCWSWDIWKFLKDHRSLVRRRVEDWREASLSPSLQPTAK